MTIELTRDLRWINEFFPHDGRHEHVSVYLLENGGRPILIDSGSFYHRAAIRDRLEAATDGDGIDAIVLSHSDYPHAGNVDEFRAEWGDVELVASSGSPEIQGLADARRCTIGGSLDVLGRRFSFIDPPLADRSHTTWIYDHESGALFTADGFGSYHEPGTCEYTAPDFDDGVSTDAIYEFHRNNLVWLRYVDPPKLRDALEAIFDEYAVSWVAPIHGHPIRGDDLDRHLDRLIDATGRIAAEYDVPNP